MIERPWFFLTTARAALTAAANGAARANRPRWLIYLGAVAVVGAILFALYNVTRNVAAQSALKNAQSQLASVETEVKKIKAIQDADATVGGDRTAPDSHRLSKISRIGVECGLVIATESEGDDFRGTPSKAVKRKRYDFKVNNQLAAPVLTWLKRVTAELDGTQINRIEFSPADGIEGKPGWNVSVTFTRWERAS
ncbi:MAG: hypothetical protein QM783_00920 [Phycisphaerales bacterium]